MEKLPGIRNQKNISVNIRVSEGTNISIYRNGFLCSQISRVKFQEKTKRDKDKAPPFRLSFKMRAIFFSNGNLFS